MNNNVNENENNNVNENGNRELTAPTDNLISNDVSSVDDIYKQLGLQQIDTYHDMYEDDD